MLQEAGGDFRFLFQAPGSEDVGVGYFSWGVFEPFYFDDALFRQFREDVVGFAEAHAGLLGYSTLGEVGLGRQEFEDFVADFLFECFVHGGNMYNLGAGTSRFFLVFGTDFTDYTDFFWLFVALKFRRLNR